MAKNFTKLLAAATLALSTAAFGAGQFSATYKIPADVVNNGIGDMSSASYKLSSSLGDAFSTVPLTSASYKLNPGFRAVTGTPAINLSVAFLTFAARPVGSPSPVQTVTVTNTGSASLSLSAITVSGANAAEFATGGTCTAASVLVPAAGCLIDVTFTPGAAGGRAANLIVASNDPASPTKNVSVSGTGIAPVMLTVATTGSGTVTSIPAGISCPGTCAFGFASGTAITLTAAPAAGYVLSIFTGCDSAAGLTCTINSLTLPIAVSATFSTIGATAPGAPTAVSAIAGNARATLAFTAAASDGGSSITGYTVTCTAAGQITRTITGASSPITVVGLSGGVAYSCTVTASNIIGTSAPSTPVVITPAAIDITPILMLLLLD